MRIKDMDISGQVAWNPLSKELNHSRYLLTKATELLWGNIVFGVICSSLCVYLEDMPKFREHGCEFHEHQGESSKMCLWMQKRSWEPLTNPVVSTALGL